MRRILVAALLIATVAPAAADPVTVVSGNKEAATVTALAKVRSLMAVCWQRKPPASVKLTVAVAKNGQVTKATAKTKGGAAQCAAGILAVSTLAPTSKAWKGVVVLTSAADGKAADARAVNDALVASAETLRGCQTKDPAFVGAITLRVAVDADGTLSDATGTVVEGSGGKKVASCVAEQARKLTYPTLSAALTYELRIQFAGGDEPPAGGDDDDLTGGAQPSKKGPLDADALLDVIRPKHDALRACAKKSKARGKVVVRVQIGKDGAVVKASIKSSELEDEKVETCLTGVFKKLSFPTAADETVVQYPLLF